MDDRSSQNGKTGLSEGSWPSVEEARILVVGGDELLDDLGSELEEHNCVVSRAQTLADVHRATGDLSPHATIIEGSVDGDLAEVVGIVDADDSCITIVLVESCRPETLATTIEAEADTMVSRPVDAREILRIIEQELRLVQSHGAGEATPIVLNKLVGESGVMNRLCHTIALAAPSSASVLVTGESGTGKELVARAVHRLSPRRTRPFVAVNCGAIPVNLLESELFGHEKGAFTGATERRVGRFEQADTGTLFLDEIGELPGDMQVKLLRVLQQQLFERVGGSETIDVDVRVIAATNRSLADDVEEGAFRADLFYRLNVLQIETPPLRERKEDIQPLWTHMIERAASEEARVPPETSTEVLGQLFKYHWPGNVRELENVARHAVTLSRGEAIGPDELPAHFRRQLQSGASEATAGFSLVGPTMEEIERRAILSTYEVVGNVRDTADLLDISERKIYYRLKQYRENGHLADEESGASEVSGSQETTGATHAESDSDSSSSHTREAISGGKPRLILAEDDQHVRWALQEILEDDFEVMAVANGRALVELVRDGLPDVIVSDVRMPGLDGIQVLRELHNESWDVPMVLITAFGDDATRSQADLLGAAAVLDKPLDMDVLRSELQRVLEN